MPKVKTINMGPNFEQKPKIDLPYNPVTPLLGIFPKECKPGYNTPNCTVMFIATLFTIVKLQMPKTD
jgi:hypothetical protein